MKSSLEGELTAALEAARRGNDQAALVHALAAWRLGRGPRLAAVVEIASEVASRGRPPVVAARSFEAGWKARAASKDPADLPVLLKVLGQGRAEQILARLETLSRWPADPRIHRTLVEFLVEPPLPGKAGRRVSERVFAELLKSRDFELARISAAICAREEPYQSVPTRLWNMGVFIWRAFEAVAEKMKKFKPPAALSGREVALCEAVEAALKVERKGTRSGEALLAAVCAAPADDQARLVYADWLTERGDPRGEFIVLQCARAKSGGSVTKRERQLEKHFGRTWAEALGIELLHSGLEFSRGFLAEATISRLPAEPESVEARPAWATLEVVRLSFGCRGSVALLNHPAFSSLKAVLGLPVSEVFALTRQVERLGLRYFDLKLISELPRQRALRSLELDAGIDLGPLQKFLTKKMPWVVELEDGPTGRWRKSGSTWARA